MLRATCKSLRAIVDDRSVWYSVLVDLTEVKNNSYYSLDDLAAMSSSELREASVRILRVDRAFRSPKLPHRRVLMPANIDTSECADMALFPGGERLLVLGQDGSLEVYCLETGDMIMAYPSLDDSWSSQMDIHTVHPTSMHCGYITIVTTDYNPDSFFADVHVRALRVYRYFRYSMVYLFTERELHPDVSPCFNLSFEQDAIRVTQFYLPSPTDLRLVGVSTRVVDANGNDTRESTHFYVADTLPYVSIGWGMLELLSPEYIILFPPARETPCTAYLIDITQASKHTDSPALLHPFWSAEFDSPLTYLGKSILSGAALENHRNGTRERHGVSALLISKKRMYSLHIPLYSEGSDVRLTSIPIPIPSTPLRIELQMYGDLNHGVVRMQHFPELFWRRGRRSRNFARTGLWSYAVDYAPHPGARGDPPGYMRLDRETNDGRATLPELRLGNTSRSFTEEGIEAESMDFRVDTISGKFVRFAQLPMLNRPGEAAIRRVEMYVFGDSDSDTVG